MKRNKPITIGGVEVTPGTRRNIDLPIADLYTTTALHMPLQVICGRQAGPTAFVSAAVHGDEINGVEIVRRVLRLKALTRLRGNLLMVPVVNVHGFLDRSRYLPDRRDLNRSFPGSPSGSIAARLAHTFTREVAFKADFGIDLHTGALDRSNLPQIRVTRGDEEAAALAAAFGAPVVIGANEREGSLRSATAEHDIPVIVYEAGEALRFDELSIKAGVRGILRVLRASGMLPGGSKKAEHDTVVATNTSWVRAPSSGIVTQRGALGRRVQKGDSLAIMTDPLGERADAVISPISGLIIGRSNLPLAHEGDALFHVASFDSVTRAEGIVEDFATTHDPALGRAVENELIGT
jgi:predicted deacylase